MRTRFILTILVITSLLFACSPAKQAAKTEQQRSLLLFGTLIEITLYDVPTATAEQAFTELDTEFARWHQNWSPWTDGELAQLNLALSRGQSFKVDSELAGMIRAAADLSARSQHLFNPAIGNLVNLWQFHRADEADIKPPAASRIAALVAQQPKMSDLTIQGDQISSRNPAVQLSLGAFAKGYAIDIAIKQLQRLGIHNAVINAGGDLKVSGQHGDRQWRIGIRHPRQSGVLGWLDVQADESVFTSGDYERFYMYQGKRMHHILDPRTGYPSTGFTSVTVIHHNAGLADAAATALMVAGPQHWQAIARALDIHEVMLVAANGTIYLSPAMAARVHLSDSDARTIISEPL